MGAEGTVRFARGGGGGLRKHICWFGGWKRSQDKRKRKTSEISGSMCLFLMSSLELDILVRIWQERRRMSEVRHTVPEGLDLLITFDLSTPFLADWSY